MQGLGMSIRALWHPDKLEMSFNPKFVTHSLQNSSSQSLGYPWLNLCLLCCRNTLCPAIGSPRPSSEAWGWPERTWESKWFTAREQTGAKRMHDPSRFCRRYGNKARPCPASPTKYWCLMITWIKNQIFSCSHFILHILSMVNVNQRQPIGL